MKPRGLGYRGWRRFNTLRRNSRTGGSWSIHFDASVVDRNRNPIADVPVEWSINYVPPEGVYAPAAPGQIKDGTFVADWPGVFTVYASAGPLTELPFIEGPDVTSLGPKRSPASS